MNRKLVGRGGKKPIFGGGRYAKREMCPEKKKGELGGGGGVDLHTKRGRKKKVMTCLPERWAPESAIKTEIRGGIKVEGKAKNTGHNGGGTKAGHLERETVGLARGSKKQKTLL